jgi:AcrR family transcriptional regulator
MTEIASRAGASIGAVYQYFPNKEAITAALRAQYVKELEARWASLETEADRLDAAGLGRKIIEHLIAFSEERPAFIPSLSAPKGIRKDPAVRKAPGLSRVEALQIANVTLQVVKGLNELRVEARAHDRPLIVSEYKVLLSRYLTSRLASER